MNGIDLKLISDSLAANAMLVVGFSSKNACTCAMFSGVTAISAIGAGDASCGVEAVDEPFEGVLVRDCMMI